MKRSDEREVPDVGRKEELLLVHGFLWSSILVSICYPRPNPVAHVPTKGHDNVARSPKLVLMMDSPGWLSLTRFPLELAVFRFDILACCCFG